MAYWGDKMELQASSIKHHRSTKGQNGTSKTRKIEVRKVNDMKRKGRIHITCSARVFEIGMLHDLATIWVQFIERL